MIRFFENYSLKKYNSFGVDAMAKFFFEFTELKDLMIFLRSDKSDKEEKLLVVGDGSNILFLTDFDGQVIHPNIPGIDIVREDRQNVWVEVGAGEKWDEFVSYCVDYRLGGIENLSLIPGTVGAAPVQNIGAYGQEVCTVIEKIKGYDLEKKEVMEFSADECLFSYRSSIFKHYLKNRFIISSVVFRLDKFPEFNLKYGILEEKVKEKGEKNLQNIRQAVIEIRSAKLPDVKNLGNAGSFFKNPEIDIEISEKLKIKYNELAAYPAKNGTVKLAAGWLIENAGWKGYREGDAGVHEKQALVLVNYGNASGTEIINLAKEIQQKVKDKYGISIEPEVSIL